MTKHNSIQWWFVNPDTFVPGRYFRINEFSGLLNRPSAQEQRSVPALFVRISEISGARINESSLYCIQLWIRPVLFSPYGDLKLIRPVLNSPTLQFSYTIL